jgi:hypothetical protein
MHENVLSLFNPIYVFSDYTLIIIACEKLQIININLQFFVI